MKRSARSTRSSLDQARKDPVKFAELFLNYKLHPYQKQLLRDPSKRIVVRMCRQSGKTTCLGIRAIWFAITKPNTTTLLVTPSLRQSLILMQRIIDLLHRIPPALLKRIIPKIQGTQQFLSNGSRIYALPCAQQLLRGFTAHQVLADEAAFFKDDESIFYNILLPMFATTDGTLIASSTPWNQDSVFYKFNQDPSFSKHIATWRDAVKAGLIKQEFIDEQKRLLPVERFQMEYEAEFIEDSEAWLPRALIMQCLDPALNYTSETIEQEGSFYIGVDLGKKVDHSVIAVIRKDTVNQLIHLKTFPLNTPYTSVIGYLKLLTHHLHNVLKINMDQTGVGEYIVEDTRHALTQPVQGIMLSLQRKEEILNHLKQQMTTQQLAYPYDRDLLNELNTERYELTRDGHIRFFHRDNEHDDRLWALALATYATRTPQAFNYVPQLGFGKAGTKQGERGTWKDLLKGLNPDH